MSSSSLYIAAEDEDEDSNAVLRCVGGITDGFKVGVGQHQGSALSSFMFAVLMESLTDAVGQEYRI